METILISVCVLLSAIGGVLYRVRGGWFNIRSTTIGRLVWVVPTVALVCTIAYDWLSLGIIAVAGIVASWVAYAVIGHSAHMTMGQIPVDQWSPADGNWTEFPTFWLPKIMKRDGHEVLYDWLGMSIIGFVRGLLLALTVCWFMPWALLWAPVGFILSGTVYYVGWRLLRGTEAGEVATGAYTWAAIAITYCVAFSSVLTPM